MPTITPTVKQFGLFQASGTLASIVDGDAGVGWAPLPDELTTYTANFLDGSGNPNSAASFPGFEFDFGTPVRVPTFLFQTETQRTLTRGMLIASNNPATSVADMVQSGDLLLGIYTTEELNAGRILTTRAKTEAITGRYLRLVMRSGDEEAAPDTSDPDYVDPSAASQYDTAGPVAFLVPDYEDVFTIEGWGAGASGGVAANANAGGTTTCDTYSLTANGGSPSAIASPNANGTPAPGGTATGGNTTNTTGGAGGLPSPFNSGDGESGKGGDAPNGGLGGAAVANGFSFMIAGLYPGFKYGNAGAAPGGGGSGRNLFSSVGGGTVFKYPGGGSGGYFKHVLHRGVDGPNPGDVILGFVGAGGTSSTGDGSGANGRLKFSYIAS
jgi:hypothetical protein